MIVTENVAEVWPAGMITVGVTVAREGRLEVSVTVWSVAGAEGKITVPVTGALPSVALAGEAWLGSAARPLILVGDMNATPRAAAYRTFAGRLTESRRAVRLHRRVPTFPSTFPVLEIDHVFVSEGVAVVAVRTPLDPLSRLASDHLPLVVDFSLSPAPA